MIEALNFSLVVFTYKMAFAACIRIDELDDFLFIQKFYLVLMFDYETVRKIIMVNVFNLADQSYYFHSY